ncbi:MAG: hypothetical protein FWE95_04005 [Planctomycetaceae bacterium]|nr:hypothetical protein [Planctomycetaceae bacterium]
MLHNVTLFWAIAIGRGGFSLFDIRGSSPAGLRFPLVCVVRNLTMAVLFRSTSHTGYADNSEHDDCAPRSQPDKYCLADASGIQ